MPERPVLYAFDGSDNARRAVEQGAARLRSRRAVLVTVWRSAAAAAPAARVGLPDHVIAQGVSHLDDASEEQACETAAEGAALLREAGVEVSARAERCETNPWWTILALADELDAETIVVGSRGRSRLRAAVLGSTSSCVVRHSSRPVLVVH